MEIRHGLIYLRHSHEIIGLVDGPIPENKVSTLDPTNLHEKTAKKVMAFIVTTMDGTAIPIAYLPTQTASGKWFYEQVSIFPSTSLSLYSNAYLDV